MIKLAHPKGDLTEVSLHRPSGRDMIALAPHLTALLRFSEQEAAAEGEGALRLPGADVFEAMVVVAGILTGIGVEAAGDLDFADISAIMERSSDFLGEALAGGAQTTGASPSA